jgi:hypothetical protein
VSRLNTVAAFVLLANLLLTPARLLGDHGLFTASASSRLSAGLHQKVSSEGDRGTKTPVRFHARLSRALVREISQGYKLWGGDAAVSMHEMALVAAPLGNFDAICLSLVTSAPNPILHMQSRLNL